MTTAGIIQARMGSSRLPGKVMLPLAGFPVIEHDIRAQRAAKRIDTVVVATTERRQDDVIARHARRLGVEVYRGDEEDVVGRIHAAARGKDADAVVRQTGDHPLLDPAMMDAAVERLLDAPHDLATNRLYRCFPRGTAVEAFTMDTIAALDRLADGPEDREKPTRVYEAHRDEFDVHDLEPDEVFDPEFLAEMGDLTRFRVVLDEPADYERLWRLYENVEFTDRLPLRAAIRYLDSHDRVVDREASHGRG